MNTLVEQVQKAASSLSECVPHDDKVVVPTHFLYPSRSHVCVFVSTTLYNSFVVSDGAGAVDTISAHGIELYNADRFLNPFCSSAGLRAVNGAIASAHIPAEELAGAIVVVAETSARAASHAVHKYRPRKKRDLYGAVKEEIDKRFAPERVRQHEKVIGASHRQYRFDFVVTVSGDRTLLLDVVMPEQNSINAKAAANIDVARADKAGVTQMIVYDDKEAWNTEDLNFVQLAAPTIALSRLPVSLQSALSH